MSRNVTAIDALARVRAATATRREADAEWRAAIIAAVESNEPIAHVAAEAGISRQAVYAILDGATDRAAGR